MTPDALITQRTERSAAHRGDPRAAREIIARYPQGRRSALLPMLHLVQSEEGYVTPDGIALCAEVLGLTKAEVGAVATFYTMYKRRPVGDYLVSVCTNTSCEILGGDAIFAGCRSTSGVGHDETTADGTSPSSTPSASRPATTRRS